MPLSIIRLERLVDGGMLGGIGKGSGGFFCHCGDCLASEVTTSWHGFKRWLDKVRLASELMLNTVFA